MERTTKRIVLSIITLVLVVVALGTTTFAWFTLSNVSTVGNIEGQVMAGDGLEVAFGSNGDTFGSHTTSLNTEDWRAFLAGATVDNGLGFGPDRFTFGAVTTVDGVDFLTTVLDAEDETSTDLIISTAFANQDYLEFELHFQSRSGGSVYWTNYNFMSSNLKQYLPDIPYIQGTGTTNKTQNGFVPHPTYALRVQVVEKDVTPAMGQIVQAGTGNNNTVMGEFAQVAGQFSYLTEKRVSIIDQNGKMVIAEGEPTEDEILVTEIALAPAATTLDNGVVVANLSEEAGADGFHRAVVTVRFWLEGWDADTYDAIFGLPFEFDLTFDKEPSETPTP